MIILLVVPLLLLVRNFIVFFNVCVCAGGGVHYHSWFSLCFCL
jgi:hypothetical protein